MKILKIVDDENSEIFVIKEDEKYFYETEIFISYKQSLVGKSKAKIGPYSTEEATLNDIPNKKTVEKIDG